MHSGAMCTASWCTSGAAVETFVWAHLPSTKELFQIFSMHVMNREIIPDRKRGFSGVLYNLWPLLTPWVAASRSIAVSAWLKLKGVAGQWLVQHTAPVRAKPFGRPCLEGVRYKYLTSCSLPTYPSSTLYIMHTLVHTYQFSSCPWPSALDHYEVRAPRSRVGWNSARSN